MALRLFLLTGFVAICAALAAQAAVPATAGPLCPTTFSGPNWKNSLTGVSGKTYEVTTIGTAFTCKAATGYVKKFVTEPIKGGNVPTVLKGGPKGYTCKGSGEGQRLAARGSCLKLTGGAPSGFGWSPTK